MSVNSLSSMLDLFEDSLLVRDIAEPLAKCDTQDDAQTVAATLREKFFDVVGVRQDGELVGYARTEDLTDGAVGSNTRSFSHRDIVGARTPLADLLPLMPDKEWLFVLHRAEITHIVTRGDLHKPPVRLLLFGHVTVLEMHLLQLVSVCYPGEKFREVLKPKRIAAAEALLADRRNRNEDIDLADCLQWCDKRTLLCSVPGLPSFFGFEPEDGFESFLKEAEKLRNKLAHAQDVVSGTTWSEIINVFNCIIRFLRDWEGRADDFAKRFGHVASGVDTISSPAAANERFENTRETAK